MPPDLRGARVLIVGDWPPPLGGVSVHVRALRDAAVKAGARATVLDISKGRNSAPGVMPAGTEAGFAARLAGLCAAHDLVHVHTSGANPKSWVLTALVGATARLTRTRAVVTFHSGHGPRYLTTPARAFAARAALAAYDRVVCVNEEISRQLTRIGAAVDRHVVAPAFGREGVEPGQPPKQFERWRKKHRRIVSAMLAPGRDYGAPELFEAFARLRRTLPDASLCVYGPGTDDESTRELAKRFGASPLLRLGQLERTTALGVIRDSDVFVRPTLVDGDAVSVREALALGVPVVATRVGTRPARVRLCEPGDVDGLAKALHAALTEPREDAPLPADSPDGIDAVLGLYRTLLRRTASAPPIGTTAA